MNELISTTSQHPGTIREISGHEWVNPLTLKMTKTGLMIWEIFYLQKHFLENI